MREIEILRQLDHPFIAKIFSVFAEAEGIAIVQEYASRRTLFDQITNHGPVSETQAKYYFMQLIAVLEYLHFERKVTHRDFKLENILLDAYDNIKVVDFGLSRTFSDDNQRFTTPCGSPPYLAPELLSTGIYTPASDIWSLGIVLYSIVIGSMPFFHNDFQTLCRQILSKKIRYPMFLSDDLIDLLKKMLCRQPSDRITIQQITNHPWFPHKQYQTVIEACKSVSHFGDHNLSTQIDESIIAVMISNGIDCTGLCEALESGEENEMTVLYNIYLRQKQAERMNYLLRMSSLQTATGQEQKFIPIPRPRSPGLFLPGSRTDRRGPRRGQQQEITDRRDRRGPKQARGPADVASLRNRDPIQNMRPFDSLARLVETAGH
jgi:serine/threonine protein kinase